MTEQPAGAPDAANERILVPVRAESEDGMDIGDALTEIGPENPNYEWEKEGLRRKEAFYQKYPHLRP
jgi:hypothetical protein